jgi:hypothetical protein
MKQQLTIAVLFFFFGNFCTKAQTVQPSNTIENFKGFFNFSYDASKGSVLLEVPKTKLEQEFLYVHSLRTGLGSNDIGIDRGQLGGQAIVKFIKAGNTLLLQQPNLKYRANTNNAQEKKSIKEAFATSILFGFTIKETKGDVYIIDLSPYILQDAHKVAATLKRNTEGAYKLDKSRSVVWMERTKSFPKNSEFEALLTFTGEPTGKNLRTVAPDASSVSVIQHISFVELPDTGYTPRAFDPRSGSFSISYLDYSTPIWEPIKKRFITRHRLEKANPEAIISEAKEPIIYYVDPGTPEPVRSALLEGASWWDQAFEAIGFKNAFQVQLLPEDADPMDVRYNVIQWVHRSTRGWSYGGSVIDPRTGEIIKGHVSLGSLRIRQDFMIAQALMDTPFAERDDNYQPMLAMALARIRQLSAHEVGHTLGFAHNFAASSNNRSSVMDYPHPSLAIKNGLVDFSNAYARNIGDWDKITVAYSYTEISKTEEASFLNNVLISAQEKGLRYITDSDARAKGGAHAKAHLWDNGTNAAQELEALLALRNVAMTNFSIDNIKTGEPYSVLEDVFVPLYFYHRFQTEAAVKLIGGMDYNYAVKGDGQIITKNISKKEQEAALAAVLKTLTPAVLAIPENILALFPPRAYGYLRNRESFNSNNGVAFDALGAAATASNMTLSLLLHSDRANRLVQQKALDSEAFGLQDLIASLIRACFKKNTGSRYEKEIQKTVQFTLLQHLMNLSVSSKSIPQTKAITSAGIHRIALEITKNKDNFSQFLSSEISVFKKNPDKFKVLKAPKIPDGSPIGSFECMFLNE